MKDETREEEMEMERFRKKIEKLRKKRRKLLGGFLWDVLLFVFVVTMVFWWGIKSCDESGLDARCQAACVEYGARVGMMLDETPAELDPLHPWYEPGEHRCACSNPELLKTEGW